MWPALRNWYDRQTDNVPDHEFEVRLRDTETDYSETLYGGSRQECLEYIRENHSQYTSPLYLDLYDVQRQFHPSFAV